MKQRLELYGVWDWEIWSPDEKTLLHREIIPNGLATVGITDMFEQYLNGGTGLTFFIGLIDNTDFDAVAPADTMSSHTGWTEITAYDEGTRPAWGPDTAASKLIVNSTKASLTMSSAQNAKGLFLCSVSTKGGTTGILFNTALFTLVNSLQTGQVAKAGYSLTGAGTV